MPLRFKARLLQHLKHESYEPARVPTLVRDLGVDDPAEFAEAVRQLEAEGKIHVDERGYVQLPELADEGEIVGEFRGTAKGFGFVIPDVKSRDGDIFIPPQYTGSALTGDRVRVWYERDRGRERRGGGERIAGKSFSGEVLEILERKRQHFTGTVFKQGSQFLAEPDGKSLQQPVLLKDAGSKNVREGDKVVFEFLRMPEGGSLGEAVITKVLGEAGMPDVETQAVIEAYDLPGEFPEGCLLDARAATEYFEEEIARWEREGASALPGRDDITSTFIATIDPPDAKDYDDAISIRRLSRAETGGAFEGWELGVHIADVAHFIRQGSELDVEAYARGNSVYLPRLVIPMLPELLSNGICSLQEGVPRFAKSAFMWYDRHGKLRRAWCKQTLIKSSKRLTYLEAQAIIDRGEGWEEEAKKHARTEPNYTPELLDALDQMNQLARAIERRRHAAGMIHLDLKEVNLIFDENGHVVDAEEEDDAYTHTLIEMFMVEANEVVARLFRDLGVPAIRRVHPEPVPGDVDNLQKAATVAGFKIPKNPTREEMQALLDATAGTPAAAAVHMAILRTLAKAEYSPAQIGHFALASDAYSHFTSPIRRYPDLTIHRSLEHFLELTDNGTKLPASEAEWKKLGRKMMEHPKCPPESELEEIGRHCSQTEQNAAAAERELRQFLVLQLLAEKHIGDEFAAVVTGVLPRGVFVQLEKYLADGLIAKENLPGDVTRDAKPPRWQIDSRTGGLVDVNSGRSYNMGDRLRVVIAAVDLARRQLELTVADPEGRAAGKAKSLAGLKIGGATAGGGDAGGLGTTKGMGFKERPGAQRRSMKSKSRDKRKSDYRDDRKGKGKRQ